MSQPDRTTLLSRILESELRLLPAESQQAYLYLFARVAVELGTFTMVNDRLPEGGMRLVLRDLSSGRLLLADRPAEWTSEEEERYVAAMRTKLLGSGP
jgi:hypothetical protein